MPSENLSDHDKNDTSHSENSISEEVPSNNQGDEAKCEKDSIYPLGIPFLLAFKFGERFTFFTFFVILTLYLNQELNFDESTTQTVFHTFLMMVYFMPLFGALLADLVLAKFWSIICLSVTFIVGNLFVFSGSTLTNMSLIKPLSVFGLCLIAVANGGLKPCCTSFGGDQFEAHQAHHSKRFYSLYFFVIYCSHILAGFLAPILRTHVRCFERDTCYPLAFGTTALVISIGTITFLIGKPFFRIVAIQEGILVKFFQCIGCAVLRKIRNKNEKKKHWLDYATDKFDENLISDIKVLFHVLQVLIPLPVFVTLFHQVGSTWVLQGSKMDGELFGYLIKPDQMVILLPILLSIIIPTFEFAVYPLCNKLGLLRTNLQKIGTGLVLNALSFMIAGFIQLRIESDLPIPPKPGFTELTVVNNCPCDINVTGADNIMLKGFETKIIKDLPKLQERRWNMAPTGCSANKTFTKSFKLDVQFQVICITLEENSLQAFVRTDDRIKLKNGNPRVRLFFRTDSAGVVFLFRGKNSTAISANNSKTEMTKYFDIQSGKYKISLRSNDSSDIGRPVGSTKFRNGGSYILIIYQNLKENTSNLMTIVTLKWNSVHMLFQLPQYILIASAEVMFVITGTTFSYNEAPASLKAIVQSFWFMVYAFGNSLLLIIKPFVNLLKDSHRFFVYGTILLFAMMIFMVITHFYTYIHDENKK